MKVSLNCIETETAQLDKRDSLCVDPCLNKQGVHFIHQ